MNSSSMPSSRPKCDVLPLAARALALLDDRLDRGLRGRQIRDRDELRETEVLARRLGVGAGR